MRTGIVALPMPICEIFWDGASQQYGFRCYFDGLRPHQQMIVFSSQQNAMDWIDPQRERIWEEPRDARGEVRLISRAYRDGSVGKAMLRARV